VQPVELKQLQLMFEESVVVEQLLLLLRDVVPIESIVVVEQLLWDVVQQQFLVEKHVVVELLGVILVV
jgi:hypothetical protein